MVRPKMIPINQFIMLDTFFAVHMLYYSEETVWRIAHCDFDFVGWQIGPVNWSTQTSAKEFVLDIFWYSCHSSLDVPQQFFHELVRWSPG